MNQSADNPSPYNQLFRRDGTSQAARRLAALDPDYVSVDERSLKDLLAFAREYAKELQYFDVENGQVQAVDDWRNFLRDVENNKELNLDDVVAFMQEPAKFSPEQAQLYTRPHFVLFLTFLQLLDHVQAQLNTLTRRHLDFYYQQVLRMTKKPGTPNQVHVLVDLAPDSAQFLLPAGTALDAGTDSLGQDLIYRTDRDIVVNQAQVAQLRSIYIDRRVTGIREAREEYEGSKTEAFMSMLQIALGQPQPGDPLPFYEMEQAPVAKTQKIEGLDGYDFLKSLKALIDFVNTNLFMDFSDFRSLIRLKHQREQANDEWIAINKKLEIIGKATIANFEVTPADSRDFDNNLKKALGNATDEDIKHMFDGVPEVASLYDAYDKRGRPDLKAQISQRIRERLHLEMSDFTAMMQLKVQIENEWFEINRILVKAGQKKRINPEPPYSLPADASPTNFEANLVAAVGPLEYPHAPNGQAIANIDQYATHFLAIENYFFMSAKNFSYLISIAERSLTETAPPSPTEWDTVYEILAEAYKKKVYASLTDELAAARDKKELATMIGIALGEKPDQDELDLALSKLRRYITSSNNEFEFLETVSQNWTKGDEVGDKDWDRVYRIVQNALYVRLGIPVAQKVEWLNLYPAEDATKVEVKLGLEAEKGSPRWSTFGQGQPAINPNDPPPASFGWAISSPLLALSQGVRTISLTLGFQQSDHFNEGLIRALFPVSVDSEGDSPLFLVEKNAGPFRIELTTEKGWIEPDTLKVGVADYYDLSGMPKSKQDTSLPALKFELTFEEDKEAIGPLPDGETRLDPRWPVLRIILRPISDAKQGTTGTYSTPYQHFQNLVLAKTHLNVGVSNLTEFQVENDETVLDSTKPFEPFGTSPSAGSRFYFGHPEIVYKKLDRLDFNIEWMGVPKDMETYYKTYSDVDTSSNPVATYTPPVTFTTPVTNQTFTARMGLMDKHLDVQLAGETPLFNNEDARQRRTIPFDQVPGALQAGRPGYVYNRDLDVVTGEDLRTWSRYWQWELNSPDFQHGAFPTVVAKKSLALTTAISKGEGSALVAEHYQVNPPYTPTIKQMSLGYAASVEIRMAAYKPESQVDRIFHIQPFGYSEVEPEALTGHYPFLPQYHYEGELYIGIQEVHPPQNLSFLFQMAEGSANPDLDPAPIAWSYLSGNRWISLDNGNVLQDTTRGLINSGIISFALEPVHPSTLLPSHLYWIRAAIPRDSYSVCDTVAIHTQAVSATFVDQDNAPDHVSRPLPAESIADLVAPLPEVSAIRQPYTSYGGKMAEQDSTFYTRISERLRHKHRALTLWDYEHLLLEQFPQVYKAKCLPANPNNPGHVELIIIPDIKNKLPFNPFEPKAPTDLIADIETYLASHTSAFATVKVRNAHYVPIKVRFAVRFRPGYNEGFYKQRLNEEINRFLSPWAYEDGAEIVIGGRIYANVIVNFIEERPYIDYVAEIKLFSSEDGGQSFNLARPSTAEAGTWVETNRPDGVLVAARQHEIDMISDAGYEAEDFTGINYMKIELDFIVG
ncbi:MAG: baseplate J/gp47 family protein [Anaerolineae bacterium]|nr:baseplate J/gp47 family protein [Anaerolineae bacterium]